MSKNEDTLLFAINHVSQVQIQHYVTAMEAVTTKACNPLCRGVEVTLVFLLLRNGNALTAFRLTV